MKKYKDLSTIAELQNKIDQKYGRGKYQAFFILLLFMCLTFTSCANEKTPAQELAERQQQEQRTQQNQRTAGTRITITDTGQIRELEEEPVDLNDRLQRISRAYFAKKTVTQNDTQVNFEQINDSILGKVVYLVLETNNMAGMSIDVVIRPVDATLTGSTDTLTVTHLQPPTAAGQQQTTVFTQIITTTVGNLDALNNNQGSRTHYTNLATYNNKAIIKLRLCPATRTVFNTWAQNLGTGTANLEIVVERHDNNLCAYGDSDEEVAGAGTFLNEDNIENHRFSVSNKNFYEIYHRENSYNFLSSIQNTRKKVGEIRSYYTSNNQEVNITNQTTYYYYDQYDNEAFLYELTRNANGMIEFPANGNGFGRYGLIDAGGQSTSPREMVGQGDHFLKPYTAAALLGVIQEIYERGWNIDLGDMSSENGSDPWELCQGHHGGHGHLGRRSGWDVDFRYLDTNGNSFHGDRRTYPNFDNNNNSIIFQIAFDYGFRSNYATGLGEYAGVNPRVGGHYDHGHWGFDINFIYTII